MEVELNAQSGHSIFGSLEFCLISLLCSTIFSGIAYKNKLFLIACPSFLQTPILWTFCNFKAFLNLYKFKVSKFGKSSIFISFLLAKFRMVSFGQKETFKSLQLKFETGFFFNRTFCFKEHYGYLKAHSHVWDDFWQLKAL